MPAGFGHPPGVLKVLCFTLLRLQGNEESDLDTAGAALPEPGAGGKAGRQMLRTR